MPWILTGQGAGGIWSTQIADVKAEYLNAPELMNRIVDKVILPALARNYRASGLQVKSGDLLRAVSERGATGNVIDIENLHATVGIDTGARPYFRRIIEGGRAYSGEVKRRTTKGTITYTRSVKAATGYGDLIYKLSDGDLEAAADLVVEWAKQDHSQKAVT